MIYRQEKGTPLTAADLDDNFRELLERIEILEENPAPAEGIGEITLEGKNLVIKGTFGHAYGSFPLPSMGGEPRGPWKAGEFYAKGDWVSREENLFRAKHDHQEKTFREENWEMIFESLPRPAPTLRLQLYPFALLPEGVVGDMALAIHEESRQVGPVYHDGKTWKFFQDKEM